MPSLVKDFKTYKEVRRESKQRQQDSQRSFKGTPDKSNLLVSAPILQNVGKSNTYTTNEKLTSELNSIERELKR